MSTNRSAIAAIAIAAFLFGVSFVVVKDAVTSFPPLAFVAWRFAIGGLLLALLSFPTRADLWKDGILAGCLLLTGYALQTVGLTKTAASNSALLTGLFVVITPMVMAVVTRQRPPPILAVGALIAFIGIVLLTATDGLLLGQGDLLTLGCAVAFAGHISFLSRTAHRHPVIPFTAVQLMVTAGGAFVLSSLLEDHIVPVRAQWPAILLTGIGVSALAFLLQIWAQNHLDATVTAVFLSLIPVFAVLAAMLLLDERLTLRQWVGAACVFGAIQMVLAKGNDRLTLEATAIRAPS